jgi:hypothetical protein
MTNWKGYGRKKSWPNLRYYPGIFLDRLRKTTKTHQDTRSPGLDRTSDLSNIKKEC